jgi:hypothetical protein
MGNADLPFSGLRCDAPGAVSFGESAQRISCKSFQRLIPGRPLHDQLSPASGLSFWKYSQSQTLMREQQAGDGLLTQPNFLWILMKYVEKHYALRVHRRNGTSKLLLGLKGNPRKLGSVMELKLTKGEVLKVKIVEHPRHEEPVEAIGM